MSNRVDNRPRSSSASRARGAWSCAWWLRISGAVASAVTLASCALGPDGTPPTLPSPVHYGVAPQPAQTVAAQGIAQHFETGAQPVPQWWRLYGSDALDALVDEGLRNSPTLAAADKSLSQAREQLRAQIGNTLFPSINAYGQAERERNLGQPEAGPKTLLYNIFAGQVQVNYTFDLFGVARLSNAALASRVNMRAFQFQAAQRALAANIVTAAISAAALERQIEITGQRIDIAEAEARDDQRRYELGSMTLDDALNARQSAAELAEGLPGLRQQHAVQQHALAVLLGRTPDEVPADLALDSLHLPDSVPVVVPSALLRTRPDIEAASAALKAAAADVGVATAQMLPSVSVVAALAQGGFTWPLATSAAGKLWTIGGSITQPIFNGGALRAQRRGAIDAYDAATSQYKQTVLAAFQDVANALAALEHDAQALDAANMAARTARQAYAQIAGRYRSGSATLSASRSSEQRYLNARLDEIRYMSTRLSDTAALFQAMGQPLESDNKDHPAAAQLARQ